jgi:hypothetical protein
MPSDVYILSLAAWLAILVGCLLLGLRVRRARRRQKRSTRLVDAGLGSLFVLGALTLPELYFAFLYDATDSFSQTNVSKKWFERHVVANAEGFRDDRELPASRESGRVYIGFAGDSFTFGHGVRRTADRFSDRVAREFDAAFPDRTRVFNASLAGLEIRALTDGLVPELIRAGTPVDVLVYVFVPNDIEYLDERTAEFYRTLSSKSPEFWLWRDTYFYNWLYHRLHGALSAKAGDYYGYLADAYAGEPWPRFAAKLDQLQLQCETKGIELRVVIFPFLSKLGGDDPFAAAYERLASHCAEREIPCLDLRPALLPHLGEGLTVNRFDAHPNERAHHLAAAAILVELKPVVAERVMMIGESQAPTP